MSSQESSAHERQRMRGSTAVFAAATLISRMAGLAREIASSAVFGGATTVWSAFTVASQIPNLIRSLVADAALSASFVPVFTELREQGDEERAWRVASTLVSLVLIVLGPLTILCMATAPWIVGIFTKGGFAGFDTAVDLFRVMMPIVVLMALSGVVVGILNAYDHFSTPALAPVAWNAVILAALAVVVPEVSDGDRIYVYTIAVVVGTVVQFAMPIPWLRGRGGRLWFAVSFRDPAVRKIVLLMLPVTISLGLINLNLLINTYFSTGIDASMLAGDPGGGPAALDKAFRIYMLPQGIFSVAISTVFFPALARYAVRADHTSFRSTFADGLRQIFVLLLPAAAFSLALAEPVVRLLYERGEFTPDQTPVVASALIGFSWGLVFNGAGLLLIRAFFSLQSPWIPTGVSLLNLTANAAIVWSLHGRFGVEGIAFATSLVNLVSFCLMYLLLQRRVGLLGTRRNVQTFVLATGASAIAALASLAVWHLASDWLGGATLAQMASMTLAFCVAATIYLAIVIWLRVIGSADLRRLLRRGR